MHLWCPPYTRLRRICKVGCAQISWTSRGPQALTSTTCSATWNGGVSGDLFCSAVVNAQVTLSTMPPRKRSAPSLESTALDAGRMQRKTARPSPSKTPAVGREASSGQTYGIATHDALFKHVLSDKHIRPSFFQAFIPGLAITSSKRLDDHMNPLQDFQHLRDFIHRKDTAETVGSISSTLVTSRPRSRRKISHPPKLDQATKFLHEVVGHFDDIKKAFPKAQYNGTMDFVCKLQNGEFALVEMQVLPKDGWDQRALAYVAAFYGNQLRKGATWVGIQKVVGINILGGGTRDEVHWRDTPDQYMRHYKFQEQLHKKSSERFLDGIELIQYSVTNAPDAWPDEEKHQQERHDWITFFKRGSRMNEREVKSEIQTKAVLKAFERSILSKLPIEVKENYDAENSQYAQFSRHIAQGEAKIRAEGEAKGILEAARRLKASKKMSNANIANLLELPESEVAGIEID